MVKMLYRLIKETGEIDRIGMKTLWSHLKYYYLVNSKFKRETKKLLSMGGIIDTLLYRICSDDLSTLATYNKLRERVANVYNL